MSRFEVRCEVNGKAVPLTKHRTREMCDRRYVHMCRLLREVLLHTSCQFRIWSQDPAGIVLRCQSAVYKPDTTAAPKLPAFLEGLEDDPGTLVGGPTPNILVLDVGQIAEMAKLFVDLRDRDVASFVLEYDGYDDSGETQSLVFLDVNSEEIAAEALGSLPTAVEGACDWFIPDGYENGDGGYGTITADVVAENVTVEHFDRYTEAEGSTLFWSVPKGVTS